MKKSKLLLVITLGLVLAMLTFTTNTFSWFNRPEEKSGNALELSLSSMPVSTGKNVTMNTVQVTLDNNGNPTDTTTAIDSFNGNLTANERNYYRTTLTNSSETDQSVSLYISELSKITGGNFFLGVNDPLKTYKQYRITKAQTYKSELKNFVENGLKNVYVGFRITDDVYDNPYQYKLHYWNLEGTKGDAELVYTGKTISDNYSSGDYQYSKVYSATVGEYSDHARLFKGTGTLDGNNGIGDENTALKTDNLMRYSYYDDKHNSYFEPVTNRSNGKKAAEITGYYENATVVKGESIYIGAQGNSLSYSSEHNNIASISNSGLIKGESEGETDIKIISTGAMGEELSVTCHVTVVENVYEAFDGTDVPIITNVKVPGKNQNDGSSGQVTIDWFIKNDGGSTMSYNIKSVYLTL